MSRIASLVAFSLLALAIAGCQEAPNQPNVASYQNPNTATSGLCGALGDCPSNTAPYAIMGNPAAGP